MNTRRFWMVWNQQGHIPAHQHWSASAAHQEAKRLALSNPGLEFFVLESAAVVVKNDVLTKPMDEADDEIPF